MGTSRTTECARCRVLERQVEALQHEVEELRTLKDRVEELEAKLAQANKNSSNSSKPPSSDLTKPPKKNASEDSQKQ